MITSLRKNASIGCLLAGLVLFATGVGHAEPEAEAVELFREACLANASQPERVKASAELRGWAVDPLTTPPWDAIENVTDRNHWRTGDREGIADAAVGTAVGSIGNRVVAGCRVLFGAINRSRFAKALFKLTDAEKLEESGSGGKLVELYVVIYGQATQAVFLSSTTHPPRFVVTSLVNR